MSNYLTNTEISLTCRLARNFLLLRDVSFKSVLADIPGLKEIARHVHCPLVSLFWDQVGELTAHIDPERFVCIDFPSVYQMCHHLDLGRND